MTSAPRAADEQVLIEAAQQNPGRFGKLYELYFDCVFAFVARRLGNRTAAEDVTAEVFHRALANLGRYQWRGAPFAAWLLRIAANAIADYWKQHAREQGNPSPEKAEAFEFDEAERRARLFHSLRTLPEEQRFVLFERFAEERSIREIAKKLGRTEGAVKQLQFRALENLRARMKESNA